MSADKCPNCGAPQKIAHGKFCRPNTLTFWCGTNEFDPGNGDLRLFRSDLCHEREARQKAEADARTLANAVRRLNRQLLGLEESELGNENKKLRELASRVISDLS